MTATSDNWPRHALFRGKRVRVLYYDGNNCFRVLERDDTERTVNSSLLTFLKEKKRND